MTTQPKKPTTTELPVSTSISSYKEAKGNVLTKDDIDLIDAIIKDLPEQKRDIAFVMLGSAMKRRYLYGVKSTYHDDEVIADLSHRLHRAILALDVALDDTGDQYYGNVRDQAKEALAAFTAEKERLK